LEDHGPLLGSPHSKALGFWACLNSGPEAAVGAENAPARSHHCPEPNQRDQESWLTLPTNR
jgi:hypothetical protein